MKVLTGYNDLQSMYPKVAKEYDKNKNAVKIMEIYGKSTKKVWWICSKGHSFEARIVDRINGNGCPYCAGKKVLYGYNDLQTCFPKIAEEWDYEKNEV